MEQSIFDGSNGLAIYQVISFMIFFLIFIGVIIWIIKMDKGLIERMKSIPLDSDTDDEALIGGSKQFGGEKNEIK
ncbi:MAG: cytochrome C oxidase Cbb3 [Ignavibacteria bacterium]